MCEFFGTESCCVKRLGVTVLQCTECSDSVTVCHRHQPPPPFAPMRYHPNFWTRKSDTGASAVYSKDGRFLSRDPMETLSSI